MPPPDPLAAYQRRRAFAQTPEPAGEVAASAGRLSFVVQKHAARSLRDPVGTCGRRHGDRLGLWRSDAGFSIVDTERDSRRRRAGGGRP